MEREFFVDIDMIDRFPKGAAVDDKDRHGCQIKDRIMDVKEGNKVAIVIVETGEQ